MTTKTVPAASATDLNLVVATIVASRLPMGNDEQSLKNAQNIIDWAADLAVKIAASVDQAVKDAEAAEVPPPVEPPAARHKV
ncbi:MAG TPA: hypothetical protein VN903_09740 [Polyangia bacterium]|nr:hypothetical protein [Polyangia bacterium]